MCARSPVDRTLASGAESVGSTPAERTIKVKLINPVRVGSERYLTIILVSDTAFLFTNTKMSGDMCSAECARR